ncbi:MAG TPA: hypothetical protein VFP31_01350 [Gaiellaceae bacterium]|nr:hypothetical protein [Gaiellaceae bacterium]
MSDPVTTEQQIQFLANVVSRLVAHVATLNVDMHLPEQKTAEEREQNFKRANEDLNALRATLEAWIQRWDVEGKPPQTPPLPKRAG